MLSKIIFAALPVAILAGCATKPSYQESLAMRPLPATESEASRECAWIRSEIARMEAIGASASGNMAVYFKAQAGQNVAALESRAANIGCYQAFSPRQ